MVTDRISDVVPLDEQDHFVFVRGDWQTFESILAARGDRRSPRIAYLDGVVELMSPSRNHEGISSTIGHLVIAYCLERGVAASSLRSWTLEGQLEEAGAEPDDCFIFGDHPDQKDRPDLAIEVVWTHGGIDKLEIYRRIGVREVWYWEKDAIRVFVLDGAAYEERGRSETLPELDLALVCQFASVRPTTAAITQFRAALAAK